MDLEKMDQKLPNRNKHLRHHEPIGHLLVEIYALILSWSDPLEKKSTGSEHFSEDTEPAEETTANDADAL